jgi:predicted ribosomally synthesized peptide with SipW-like signal peptide
VKKLGFIALALVLALGVLGVGFALWSQQLTITGTVDTGTLLVGIRDNGTNDPPPDLVSGGVVYPQNSPVDGTIDEGYDKNVGAIESINGTYKFTKDQVDYYHDITYHITNAYPCYTGTGFFAVANGGTIPVKCKTITVTGGDINEVTYMFSGITEGLQIEPCTVVPGQVSFHVEQCAAEGANYVITIELDFWQWNEA